MLAAQFRGPPCCEHSHASHRHCRDNHKPTTQHGNVNQRQDAHATTTVTYSPPNPITSPHTTSQSKLTLLSHPFVWRDVHDRQRRSQACVRRTVRVGRRVVWIRARLKLVLVCGLLVRVHTVTLSNTDIQWNSKMVSSETAMRASAWRARGLSAEPGTIRRGAGCE